MAATATRDTIPRPALWSMAGLAMAAVVAAAAGRFLGVGDMRVPEIPVVESRELRFVDRPGGGVEIRDGSTGALVDVLHSGEGGFVRGVMRGFGRERKLAHGSSEAPVRLLMRQDGRLSLVDPATGRAVELNAFGPTNLESFAKYLAVKEGKS
jgi:putative photosynthetic complex assembly protein